MMGIKSLWAMDIAMATGRQQQRDGHQRRARQRYDQRRLFLTDLPTIAPQLPNYATSPRRTKFRSLLTVSDCKY
jgi:hypothetical protein